jgi:hypothetical protein
MGWTKHPPDFAERVERAFARYMWARICPEKRARPEFFSSASPLKLMAGDVRFWMQRIYRIALDRREACFEPVPDDEEWKPMVELEREFREMLREKQEDGDPFVLRRPLYGGDLWDSNEEEEREAVIEEAIHGAGVIESLDPVIELLSSHRTHEDFSDEYSWIKEDFERSFYSKRAKLRVELVETIDDAPVWECDECEGYTDLLFRDVLAALDVNERKLLLAIRHGKTVCELTREHGLRGHASISRRLQRIKDAVLKLLQ